MQICTLLRKPEALRCPSTSKYVGWDIPNEFVVGYGLDYREQLPQPALYRHPRPARLLLTEYQVALSPLGNVRYRWGSA